MVRTLVVVLALLSQAQALSAQAPCSGNYRLLGAAEIAQRGLVPRIAVFFDAFTAAQEGDTVARNIVVRVKDCSSDAKRPRVIRLIPAVRGNPGASATLSYAIYMTVHDLRYTEDIDLVRMARRQLCIAKYGVVRYDDNFPDEPDDPSIKLCMLDLAIAAHDREYALWLPLTLGFGEFEKRSELRTRQWTARRGNSELIRGLQEFLHSRR